MIAIACALLGGVMLYLSQGVDDVWWLAWAAPAPLLWLAYGAAPRWQVFAASLAAFAAGQCYLVQCYGTYLITTELGFMLGVGALFGGVVLLAGLVWRTLPRGAALLAFPAFWTTAEYLVGLISPHGSFGSFAYSQVSFPAAIQTAALLGMYAVTFLLCLSANALALAARGARETGAAGVMVCALALAFGVAQLAAPQTSGVLVMALADHDSQKRATRKPDLNASRQAAREYASALANADPRTRLAVIPETSIAIDPKWRDGALAPLTQVARARHMTVVIGVVRTGPMRNSALAIAPDGAVMDYDKRHLLLPGEAVFHPGRSSGLISPNGAVAICKDLDFPRTIRSDSYDAWLTGHPFRAVKIMAVPANDFGLDGWIHARMAVMRGVENGFAVVRSAFNGVQTISDAQGRVIALADTGRHGLTVISATVEPGGGATLYTAIGDVFAWGCVALSLLLGVLAARNRRRGL